MSAPRIIRKAPKYVLDNMEQKKKREQLQKQETEEKIRQEELKKQLNNIEEEINAILKEKRIVNPEEVNALKLKIIRGIASDIKRKKRK